MRKQPSVDSSTRQYAQPGDFRLFYYDDTALKSVDVHEHNHYEPYFFLEGDVEYRIGDKNHQLEYGDCLLIPPDTPRYPRLHSYDKPYRRFIFWLNQDYHKELRQTDEELTYCLDHVQNHQTYRFHTDAIITQGIQGRLIDPMEELTKGCSLHRLVSELMTVSFLMCVSRLFYDGLHQKLAVYENVLCLNIRDYINRHLEESLSLDSLSSFLYVSKYHISHIFKGNIGIPLHQYILKKWLHVSKNVILSGHPINHTYLQHDFKDYISFLRAFKKEYGVSPKEYREQHRLSEQQSYTIQGI